MQNKTRPNSSPAQPLPQETGAVASNPFSPDTAGQSAPPAAQTFPVPVDGQTVELTLEELKAVSELFEADVYDALNLENCMALRSSYGGPAVAETARQIGEIEQFIQKIKENR